MTTYGLTETGFVKKPLTVIRQEIVDLIHGRFPTLPLDESTPDGFMVGVVADVVNQVWELAEAVHSARDPDKATKLALRSLCLITGTIPPPASYSAVMMLLVGDPATPIPEDTRFRIADTDRVFATVAAEPEPALAALALWTPATIYAVGNVVTTTADRAYLCITAGTSHGATEPTAETDDVTDNTVHWLFVGEGTASALVEAKATETGPVSGDARLIREIVTPIAGLNAVVNPLDATLGSEAFTDGELRVLREVELAQAGAGTVPAILSALARLLAALGLPSSNVTVFQNRTDYTDADGVPPHAVEVLISGGTNQDVAEAIFDNVAGGIRTHGTEAVIVEDEEGQDHEVRFSRPVEIPIYVTANVTYDADEYPTDGDAQVEAAIIAFGNALKNGRNVYSRAIGSSSIPDEDEEVPGGVAGVLDIECLIGLAPAPGTTTTINITARQRATFDTSRVTVNSTPGTP
jgi:hypothetical protein